MNGSVGITICIAHIVHLHMLYRPASGDIPPTNRGIPNRITTEEKYDKQGLKFFLGPHSGNSAIGQSFSD